VLANMHSDYASKDQNKQMETSRAKSSLMSRTCSVCLGGGMIVSEQVCGNVSQGITQEPPACSCPLQRDMDVVSFIRHIVRLSSHE